MEGTVITRIAARRLTWSAAVALVSLLASLAVGAGNAPRAAAAVSVPTVPDCGADGCWSTTDATIEYSWDISCVSTSFCAALGPYEVTRWNGQKWSAIPTPPELLYNAARISCSSAKFCAVVGGTAPPALWTPTLGWSTVPDVADPHELSDVSCRSATFCVAVGSSKTTAPDGSYFYKPFAERWDGASWSAMTTVDPTPNAQFSNDSGLATVSCATTNFCMAVGSKNESSLAFAEKWGGARWVRTPIADVAPRDWFGDVSCSSPSWCVAIGEGPVNGDQVVMEQWDGSAWSNMAMNLPGADLIPDTSSATCGTDCNVDELLSVSCASPSSCLAVGGSAPNDDGVRPPASTLAEKWDGTQWSGSEPPGPSGPPGESAYATWLYGVSCGTADQCMAVGYVSSADDEWNEPFVDRYTSLTTGLHEALG